MSMNEINNNELSSMPIIWNKGHTCPYAQNQYITVTMEDERYCVSDPIALDKDASYKLNVATPLAAKFRVVYANKATVILGSEEFVLNPGQNVFELNPPEGAAMMRLRLHSATCSDPWILVSVPVPAPIAWHEGYACSYTQNQSLKTMANEHYCVSDLMSVAGGTEYSLTVNMSNPFAFVRVICATQTMSVVGYMDFTAMLGDNAFAFITPPNAAFVTLLGSAGAGKDAWYLNHS